MIIGHYHHLQRLNARIHAVQPVAMEPRVAHIETVSRDQLRLERDNMAEAILEDEEWISELQGLLNRITCSPHGSAHRQLAIRHLEDAQSRLLRELGDKPPVTLAPQVGSHRSRDEELND